MEKTWSQENENNVNQQHTCFSTCILLIFPTPNFTQQRTCLPSSKIYSSTCKSVAQRVSVELLVGPGRLVEHSVARRKISHEKPTGRRTESDAHTRLVTKRAFATKMGTLLSDTCSALAWGPKIG